MQPTTTRNKQIITAFAVLVAIALIVGATVALNGKKSDASQAASTTQTTSSSPTSQSTSSAPSNAVDTNAAYKDGSYQASASYQSPGGIEQISVNLTVAGGKVTDSTITTVPSEGEAEEYQSMFKSGYKSQVIGKALGDIQLHRVSGSSLTSEGFNSAVSKIEQQAKV